MNKKITMEHIAKKLGITKNTVSLALRNMPGVSEKTRSLILDTAKKEGYFYKNNEDKHTSENKTKSICLMLSDDTRNSVGFFSFIQYGVESEAKNNNYNTILHCFDDNKDFTVPLCIEHGMISGIIILGRVSKSTINSIMKYNLPLVIIDEFFEDIKTDYILTDNLSGGFTATEYLILKGHRKIGFFGDIHKSASFYDRYLGYVKAHGKYNLPLNPDFSILNKVMSYLTGNMQTIVNELNNLKNLPTAMFCCNDIEAISIMKALNLMGISVPEDISIMGFDNIESSRNISPELTTMHISKESMGERAVRKLIEKIHGTKNIDEKILFSTYLVERQSVKSIE